MPSTGLKNPLETRRSEEQAGRGIAWERGTSQSRPPPTRLSAAQGPSCFVGRPSFGSFLGRQEKNAPRWLPLQNQRAEGTILLI
jgi:hypothetical protein